MLASTPPFPVVAAALLWCAGSAAAADAPQIRLAGKSAPTVDVAGLSAADLAAIGKLGLRGEAWTELFAVYVEPAAGKERGPALLGSYRVEEGVLRFEPRFPLAPGVPYRAVFTPSRLPNRSAGYAAPIEKAFRLPKPGTEPARVTQIYPTADQLPENLLRFYVHFSAPMSRGGVYRHIKLYGEDGKEVLAPFLELDEELWDEGQRRLTVFCDPGRIKRGLKPREEDGPVLQEGKCYTLVVDTGLVDANGNALKESFRKKFRALPPEDKKPDPRTWKLRLPASETRAPLLVALPGPLDHALLERLVRVTDARGEPVAGTLTAESADTVLRFIPAGPWQASSYRLVADTRLEDVAGNSIARPFEVDVFHPVERQVKAATVQVPFDVRPAGR